MNAYKPSILVVDDERDMIKTFRTMLSGEYSVISALSGQQAIETVRGENIDLVLLDIRMPGMNGIETLKKIREIEKDLDVIMVTASKEIKSAVECIKLGAFDYVTKPFEIDELRCLIRKALERKSLMRENTCLKTIISESEGFCELIGKSSPMKRVFKMLGEVAETDSTVLLTGESGTGKELAAKAVHKMSPRRSHAMLTVNCAAIPDNLLESELFGHEAGAFTGASERKIGKMELAGGGTIFFDEIGCMSPAMQAKLLRAIEEKKIDRVGGNYPVPVDVRIISATNIEFEQAISEGKFRRDLYYRLNVIPVRMPSLRERKEDLPLLVDHFLARFNRELKRNVRAISDEAMDAIMAYSWPGNVRELQNVIERIVALSKNGEISLSALPIASGSEIQVMCGETTLQKAVDNFEKEFIGRALSQAGGNNTHAARILGMHRTTLLSKMRSLQMK